jgi:SAM-dependent methyltransferase
MVVTSSKWEICRHLVCDRLRFMRARAQLAAAANTVLRLANLQLIRRPPDDCTRPWDVKFKAWIAEAERRGIDPNDVGDRAWEDDGLDVSLRRHYLPVVSSDATVLELGPGTGRLSRHLIGRCRELILVDYSRLVCDWLAAYLKGKGAFRVVHVTGPVFPAIASDTVDTILAHGVFEHLDLDDVAALLDEFHRVQRPGGYTVFNFDNPMSAGGLRWLQRWRPPPGGRSIFRFHHPEVVQRLAESSGFEVVSLRTDDSRLATATLRKRPGEPLGS